MLEQMRQSRTAAEPLFLDVRMVKKRLAQAFDAAKPPQGSIRSRGAFNRYCGTCALLPVQDAVYNSQL